MRGRSRLVRHAGRLGSRVAVVLAAAAAFRLVCTIADHEARGMRARLIVR